MAAAAAVVAVVVAVAAAAVSAYAAYEQGQTQKKIGKFNAKVAENKAIADRQAAALEAENKRKQYAAIMARNRANLGASGVISAEGSPLLVQIEDAQNAALNEARIRYGGEVAARAEESEAIIQKYIGKRAERQGYIQAGASLLSGVSSAAGGYASYRGRSTT